MKNLNLYISDYINSLSKISNKTGIDKEKLLLLANEKENPSYSELKKLSSFFKVSISALLKDSNSQSDLKLLYRKHHEQNVDNVILDKFSSFIDNVIEISSKTPNTQILNNKIQPRENSFQNAESMAFEFRKHFFGNDQLSPIIQLPLVLTQQVGCVIKVFELGDKIDGASAFSKKFSFLFISPRFQGRMLFTLAHELGHLVNHRRGNDFLYIDPKISYSNKKAQSIQEQFANTFAASLLLPIKGVLKLIKKIRELNNIPSDDPIGDVEILYVARFYGVSFDVAAFRLEKLDLIPLGASYSLGKKLKEEYGSPEKRADTLELPQRENIDFDVYPQFLIDSVLNQIEEGSNSIEKLSEKLSTSVSKLVNLNAYFGRRN